MIGFSRLRHWLRDAAIRRVFRSGIPVTMGRSLAALSGLATLSLLAHHLGAVRLGVLTVIRTVVGMADQYANFNTWLAIVKYGAEATARSRPDDVARIIKLAALIDLTAAVLGAAVIVGLAYAIPDTFGWDADESRLCAIYALTLVTRIAGTSDGIFRLCEAWRVQAIVNSIAALVLTGMVGACVAADAGFETCVLALIAGEVVGNVVITTAALWVARRSGYGGWLRISPVGVRDRYPGIVRFLFATNGQLTVKKTQTDFDVFVVGALLGNFATGLLRVVKQVGSIPGRVFMPFEQVLYTELTRAAAVHDYDGFGSVLRRFTVIVAVGSLAVWMVCAAAADPIVRILAGDEFMAAVPAFRWYLLAMVLLVISAPVQRAVIALGRAGAIFMFDFSTLLVLIGMVIAAAELYGLVGVCMAIVVHKCAQLTWSVWYVARELGRARRPAHGQPQTVASTAADGV